MGGTPTAARLNMPGEWCEHGPGVLHRLVIRKTPPPLWRQRLRLLPLALTIVVGLATTALSRYRPQYVQSRWEPVHEVMVRWTLDPVRTRTYEALVVLRRARDLWGVEEENRRLRDELAKTTAANQILREEYRRIQRLTGMERWSGPPSIAFLPADVVGENSYEGVLFVINRGREDGVRPRDPVIALGGLVGIVRSVSAHSANVQSVTDPLSVVGVIGVDEEGERTRGIVYGRGRNRPLEFVPENEIQPLRTGTLLISSGFHNSVFPKGLVVGVIEDRSLDPYGLPFGVVRPAVDVRSIEEVLVVIGADVAGEDVLTLDYEPLMPDHPSTASRSLEVRMPRIAFKAWDALSSPTRHFIDQMLTSGTQVLEQLPEAIEIGTSATLPLQLPPDRLRPVVTPEPATPTPVATPRPTPVPDDEPPVPPVETWIERRDDGGNQWPSEWLRGG